MICLTATAQRFDDYKAFSSGKGDITAVTYMPNGNAFASGNNQGMILVRDADSNNITHILKGHKGEITCLEFHPEGKHLVSTSKDGTLKIWDLATKKIIRELNAEPSHHFSFANFSVGGFAMLYGGTSGKVKITRPLQINGALAREDAIITDKDPFNAADYSMEGNFLVVASKNKVKVLEFASKKVLTEFNACSNGITDIKYNADGSQIGCLCSDGTLKIFDAQSTKELQSIKVTTSGPSTQIVFSPDGRYLATGDTQKRLKVWDTSTWKMISDLPGHQGAIRAVDFAPNSQFIITGGNDQMIKMWQWKKTFENTAIPEMVTPEPVAPAPAAPIATTPPPTPEPTPKPVPEPQKEPSLEDLKLTYTSRNIPDSLGNRKVRSGKRAMVGSEDVEIWVWDKEIEDGDTISIYLNGEWLLKEHALKNKKKKLKVHINRNADNYFILYAHNEGTRPPNTAALIIFDGERKREIGMSSDMKKCDAVNFKFTD